MSPHRKTFDGGSLSHPLLTDGSFEVTDEQRAKAMLTVAGYAHTVEDCRLLLQALGLLG